MLDFQEDRYALQIGIVQNVLDPEPLHRIAMRLRHLS